MNIFGWSAKTFESYRGGNIEMIKNKNYNYSVSAKFPNSTHTQHFTYYYTCMPNDDDDTRTRNIFTNTIDNITKFVLPHRVEPLYSAPHHRPVWLSAS